MTSTISRWEQLLTTVPARLLELAGDNLTNKPAGRWSKQELLGHLIDSASNNHQRFVRAQATPRLETPRYEQEFWVAAQAYATEPWNDMVNLWLLFNRHLVHIVKAMPPEVLGHEVEVIGYGTMTLEALIVDYLHHMEGHLNQLLETS